MRKFFVMSDTQLAALRKACEPVPYLAAQCEPIASVQENVNRAWDALGEELGFIGSTAAPAGDDPHQFVAETRGD